MKTSSSITALLAICSCLIGTVGMASEEVLVQSGQDRGNPDVKAVNACFTAFINQIMPEAKIKVRTVIADQQQIFTSQPTARRMNVTMTATQGSHGALLASGYCTVDRAARVQYLNAKVTNPEKLAALTIKDIALAMR